MKRKLKFKSKNRNRGWFSVNKIIPRFVKLKGGVCTSKNGYDWGEGDISQGYVEIPLLEFFLNRKSRRQGKVTFYLLLDRDDWENETGYILYEDMVKDYCDKIEVYIHEKKTDTLSST